MKITIIDTTFGVTDEPNLLRVEEFSFKKQFVKKSGFKKSIQSYDSYVVALDGSFLVGLVPHISQYCENEKIPIEIINENSDLAIPSQSISSLFNLREDQKKCVEAALATNRGVIKAPTGSGKTVLISAIISAFPEARILFLCHTLSLLKQTQEEFNNYNLGPSSIIGGGNKDMNGRIIISTVQSFSKDNILEENFDKFDIVFVDECHHCSTNSGNYAIALSKLTTPRRYGVTATLPTGKEGQLVLEGLIGPVIADFTIEEAIEQEILAVPKIEFLAIPTCDALQNVRQYSDRKIKNEYGDFIVDENGSPIVEKGVYSIGICEYRKRNRMIIEAALEKNKRGESVLIYVNMIDHGERLMEIAELMGASPIFIRGSSDAELREETRKALHNKQILLGICTNAWVEGVNIRSLDVILLAGGGKSIIALMQKIGRGLRRTDTKTKTTIITCLDQGRYISEHIVSALKFFVEKGWL